MNVFDGVMSFPVMAVNVPVHIGKTMFKLALKDVVKPIEITISDRKITTRCFPPRPW